MQNGLSCNSVELLMSVCRFNSAVRNGFAQAVSQMLNREIRTRISKLHRLKWEENENLKSLDNEDVDCRTVPGFSGNQAELADSYDFRTANTSELDYSR